MKVGAVITWGLICSNVWWLLLNEDLFFSMQASLRGFSLWCLWAFPAGLLMVPEWAGEHPKREPGRTRSPFMTWHLKAHGFHFILPDWWRQPQVPLKFEERGNKFSLDWKWQVSGGAYGTRHTVVPFWEKIISQRNVLCSPFIYELYTAIC